MSKAVATLIAAGRGQIWRNVLCDRIDSQVVGQQLEGPGEDGQRARPGKRRVR